MTQQQLPSVLDFAREQEVGFFRQYRWSGDCPVDEEGEGESD